jgi:hypothetical protein
MKISMKFIVLLKLTFLHYKPSVFIERMKTSSFTKSAESPAQNISERRIMYRPDRNCCSTFGFVSGSAIFFARTNMQTSSSCCVRMLQNTATCRLKFVYANFSLNRNVTLLNS